MAFERLRHVPNTTKVRVTLPSVPANSSSVRTLIAVGNIEGTIEVVRYSTANTLETSFHLFVSQTGAEGSLDEVLEVLEIIKCFQSVNLGIEYQNNDSPKTASLYIIIDNASTVAPTGDIELELFIQVADKG